MIEKVLNDASQSLYHANNIVDEVRSLVVYIKINFQFSVSVSLSSLNWKLLDE